MFWACLIASVGLTHIVVDGSIFAGLRGWVANSGMEWLKKLITCYQCSGFWAGVVLGLLLQPFGRDLWWFLQPLAFGLATSYAAMAAAALLNYLDRPWNEVK